MDFSGAPLPPSFPISAATEQEDVNQTFAIMYYCVYHAECLASVISDTMNASVMNLSRILRSVSDEAYHAIYNQIPMVQIGQLQTSELLEVLASHMGSYPLPQSMSVYTDFMRNEFSVGTILENMASDWIALRQSFNEPSMQVSKFRDTVIDCLRTVFYQHAEYKFVMEIMQILQENGVEITGTVKAYVKACIIATEIQLDCIDHGFMELFWFVRNTEPFYIVDTLKSLVGNIIGEDNTCVIALFQRKMNEITRTMRMDLTYSLVDCSRVVAMPQLILSGVNRAFNALVSLLMKTPLATKMQDELKNALVAMTNCKPATAENAKLMIPPAPTNRIEASLQYEMISKEKRNFMGKPTKMMVRRWGTALMNVIAFMKNYPGDELAKDCESLIDNALKLVE